MATSTHRTDNTVRGNELIGGVRVYATQYVTGRTTVDLLNLVPANAEQAAAMDEQGAF